MSRLLHGQPRGVRQQDLLGDEHVLPTGDRPAGHAGSTEASHRLLPVGAGDAAHPSVPVLHPVSALADLRGQIRNQREQPRRGGRDDPERAVSGTTRQDDQVHDPSHGPLSGLSARVPRRMLRVPQEPPHQVPVHAVRQPTWQLPGDAVPRHEGLVLRQCARAAVPPERLLGHRVSPLRHRRHRRPSHGQRLVGGSLLPEDHPLRLPDPPDGHDPPSHGPVRAANQPVQREDLHLPLVLDGVRRDDHMPQPAPMDLGAVLPVDPRALHPEAPAHHEQAEPR